MFVFVQISWFFEWSGKKRNTHKLTNIARRQTYDGEMREVPNGLQLEFNSEESGSH